jgi:hypothetical protein
MKITRTEGRDVTSHCAVTDGRSVQTPGRFLQQCSSQGQTQSHILVTVQCPSQHRTSVTCETYKFIAALILGYDAVYVVRKIPSFWMRMLAVH